MTRRLLALSLLIALAVPGIAEARSKIAKLRLPADGDMSFARYSVTTAKPEGVTIRSSRPLGSSMVVTGVRVLSRRRYEVTAMAVNPEGGAGAAQAPTIVDLIFESLGKSDLAVRKTGAADNVMTQPLTGSEASSLGNACRRVQSRIRRITRRGRGFFESRGGTRRGRREVRVLFLPGACQDESPAETAATARGLEQLGVDVPGCTGRVARYEGSANEVSAQMVCRSSTNAVSLRAPAGNDGQNCLGPQGSVCAYGQFCAPMPRESTCYGDMDGFDTDTLLEFRGAFAQPVEPRDVRGIWVSQGSQSVTEEHAYLRAVLDTP